MDFQGCSSTSILGAKYFLNAKFEGKARITLVIKTKVETGGEIVSTKGDVFIPSLPNECNLKKLDLPLSRVWKNFISMFEHKQIIDEFLE